MILVSHALCAFMPYMSASIARMPLHVSFEILLNASACVFTAAPVVSWFGFGPTLGTTRFAQQAEGRDSEGHTQLLMMI